MFVANYKIAQYVVEIRSLHQQVHLQCLAYRVEEEAQLKIVTDQSQIDFEREKSKMEDALEGLPVQEHSDGYLESLAVYRQLARKMLEMDTLLFHGSAIAVDDAAVLFTAKSGTGKSTHTRLWREAFGDRCYMVNDDKPLLRLTEDGVLVCGTPWDGKHRLSTNCQVPLKAICILERGEENVIAEISAREARPMLLQQSFRPADPAGLALLLKVMDKLTANLRFYRLQCNMDPEAAQVSYNAMLGK